MLKRRSRRLSGRRTETLRPEGVQPRQDFYNEFFQKSPIATALLDNRNDVLEINEAFHHLFGYSQEEARGQHLDTLIAYKEVVEEARRLTEDTIAGRVVTLETVRYSKSGEGIPVAILAYPVYDREQKVAVYATYADIRERLIYEKQLNTYSRILERSTEAVCIFSENGTINWVNRTFHELIGPYEEQWIETLQNLCVFRQEVYAEIMEALNAGQPWRGDVQATSLMGRQFPAWINAFSLGGDATGGSEHVILINDISDLRQKEERLDFLSYRDELTGLSNRSHFTEIFRTMVFSAGPETQIALLFIDLDDFKLINENNSHAAGDEILKYAAAILRSCLRDSDLLARYGGDEFVIAVSGQRADAIARRVVARIIEKLKMPLFINDLELSITVSIGIALYPQDGIDGNALIRHAEMAMYDAKRERKNSVQYFDPHIRSTVRDAFVIKNSLRNAIRDGELYLVYQPIVETESGRTMGLEALARWNSAKLGEIPPQRFIAIAEETHLISEIGSWVIQEACCQQMRLKEQGGPELLMAVNVSAIQLEDAGFPEVVAAAIRESGIDPRFLELEVTESIQAGNSDSCIAHLHQLKAMGVSISIDDFGTGYSSLAQLSQLPLDKLKIDRSFITTIQDSGTLIETIMAMASSLKLRVVAEGVETEAQYERLKALGCDYIQGYYFSRPLMPDALVMGVETHLKGQS